MKLKQSWKLGGNFMSYYIIRINGLPRDKQGEKDIKIYRLNKENYFTEKLLMKI